MVFAIASDIAGDHNYLCRAQSVSDVLSHTTLKPKYKCGQSS